MQPSVVRQTDCERSVAISTELTVHYRACGGVVVHRDTVLLLRRPSLGEVRLPKGHVEPGESAEATALRETTEESGYAGLVIQGDLGSQVVEFDYHGRHVVRIERFFVMGLREESIGADGSPATPICHETQFVPEWVRCDDALAILTFPQEREWVRRARAFLEGVDAK